MVIVSGACALAQIERSIVGSHVHAAYILKIGNSLLIFTLIGSLTGTAEDSCTCLYNIYFYMDELFLK